MAIEVVFHKEPLATLLLWRVLEKKKCYLWLLALALTKREIRKTDQEDYGYDIYNTVTGLVEGRASLPILR